MSERGRGSVGSRVAAQAANFRVTILKALVSAPDGSARLADIKCDKCGTIHRTAAGAERLRRAVPSPGLP
jgi:hypothetical protein